MILTFQPPKDASVFDIVINTYGTLDLIGKFTQDNKIDDLSVLADGLTSYQYDFDSIENYNDYFKVQENHYKYVTGQKFIVEAVLPLNYLLTEADIIIANEQANLFIV
jgi:hypothetical protein